MREKEGEMQKRERERERDVQIKREIDKAESVCIFSPRIIHWQNEGQNDWEGFSCL